MEMERRQSNKTYENLCLGILEYWEGSSTDLHMMFDFYDDDPNEYAQSRHI